MMSKPKSGFIEPSQMDFFLAELDEAQLDTPEFVEDFNSEVVELFETGSVTFKLNNKEITISLVIKGF